MFAGVSSAMEEIGNYGKELTTCIFIDLLEGEFPFSFWFNVQDIDFM